MPDLRLEYPRPQLVRKDWLCLNGEWDFEVDNAESGEAREFFNRASLARTITVPYCPESPLSGVGTKDYMNCVWYKKDVVIPEDWRGRRVLLHIGAVDWHAKLWVNGVYAASHRGGYVPFDADITDFLKDGENRITVAAYDHTRAPEQPTGKQSVKYSSSGCHYTRVTGIWQSVWLEPVDGAHLVSFRVYPDILAPSVTFQLSLTPAAIGREVRLDTFFDGRPTGSARAVAASASVTLAVPLSEKHLWDVGQGNLYDVRIALPGDEVEAYFGLREVGITERAFLLNGRKVFGRWVLDQGYYPDGIYTAPSDAALRADVENSMLLGFNGARLHEKVFEPRFLYWADRLGYMVWGEMANWGLDHTRPEAVYTFLPEWLEAMERDFPHPSVVGWCPFNETWDIDGRRQYDGVLRLAYLASKAADPTRPVIDVSGGFHVATDIFDVHDYEQDPGKFFTYYERIPEGVITDQLERKKEWADRQKWDRKSPVFVSEYGGIKWASGEASGWGYGSSVRTEEEFLARYKGLTDVLLDNPDIMGFCYTQLYDVEQEINGLMTYDRRFKFDPALICAINARPAAIEKNEDTE